MTSINFAKLLADERKKARAAAQANGGVPVEKKTIPELSLSYLIDTKDTEAMEKFKIGNLPTVYYIPNFVTEQESDLILQHVYSHQSKWTQLKRRRLQNWGGIPSSRGMLPEKLPPFLNTVCSHLEQKCRLFETTPNHILLNEYKRGQGIMSHKDGPLYFPRVAILSLSGPAVIEFRKDLRDSPCLSLYLEPRSLLIFQDEAYTSYFHGIQELERDEITSSIGNLHTLSPRASKPNTTLNTTTSSQNTDNTDNNNNTENKEDKPEWKEGMEIERDTRVSLTIRVVLNVLHEDKSPATQAEEEELRRIEKHWYNAINEVV